MCLSFRGKKENKTFYFIDSCFLFLWNGREWLSMILHDPASSMENCISWSPFLSGVANLAFRQITLSYISRMWVLSQVEYGCVSFKTQDATPTKTCLLSWWGWNMTFIRSWCWTSSAANLSPEVVSTAWFSLTNLDPSSFHGRSLAFLLLFEEAGHLPYLSKLALNLVWGLYPWLLTISPDQSHLICFSWHQL